MTSTSRKIVLLPALILAVVVIACLTIFAQHPRSYAQLASDASSVPVPAGVTFLRETRSVEDGPGFTTATFKEVSFDYVTKLPCQVLEREWADALQRAHRKYKIDNVPHKFGAIGSLAIVILDRPESLGVTLGTDNGYCAQPFIYSFNGPHSLW